MVGCLTIELIPVSMVMTDASTSKESLATRAVPRGDGSIADVTRVFGLGNKDVGETCGCGRRSAFNYLGHCEGRIMTWLIHRRYLRHNPAQTGPLDLV